MSGLVMNKQGGYSRMSYQSYMGRAVLCDNNWKVADLVTILVLQEHRSQVKLNVVISIFTNLK